MKYTLLVLALLLQSCGEPSPQESATIANEPQVCLDQTAKNGALWDYMNDWYLWNESLDHNTVMSDFSSITSLLSDIKEKNPIDRYSFIMDKDEYEDVFVHAQTFDYGMSVRLDELSHELVVSYVYHDSNAEKIGLTRGDRFIAIDGIKLSEIMASNDFIWSDFWASLDTSKPVSFSWRTLAGEIMTNKMIQGQLTTNAVLAKQVINSSLGKIGYLVYNSFIDPSFEDLNQAFAYFKEQNVAELVVDLRYNHGGTSTMSNQLASQIGGDNVIGRIYNAPTNNANHQSDGELFSLNNAEHYLTMSRVTFITTEESASGSEVLINSLKPYLEVKLIGQKTYGKPVGMRVAQLCEQMIFAITHHNHNADGFGDFFDGIAVDCPAIDTVAADWGGAQDPMLAEAIHLLENGQCSNRENRNDKQLKPLYKNDRYRQLYQNQIVNSVIY
jgi:C-terminal processing protease CtpA/Prc